MEGTPASSHRRSHPARRRAGPVWLTAVPDRGEGPDPGAADEVDRPSGAGDDRRGWQRRAGATGCLRATFAAPPWPGPVGPAIAGLFGALTRAQGARVFHRAGSGYLAQITITPAGRATGAPFLDHPGSFAGVVRLSRGAGVPDPFPDVLGLAIKVIDAHGSGRDQDLLLVSSSGPPIARHLLLPATGFLGRPFSSVLPYLVGRRIRLFGAVPGTAAVHDGGTALAEVHVAAARGGLGFDLTMAGEVGAWRRIGELRVGQPLGDAETDALRFSPWHTGPGITPVGILQTLRRPAYQGSQRGRT